MRKLAIVLLLLLAALSIGRTLVSAPQRGGQQPRRARRPVWDETVVGDIFFRNVLTDALVGKRPESLGRTPLAGNGPTTPTEKPATKTASSGGLYPWSRIISAETIEDEVKAIKLLVDENISTPNKFKTDGYKQARLHFTMLAMLFGIVGEYDGQIRWQKDAPAARDLFARAGKNAKAGTVQGYQEAKQRKLDLQDLVGGGSLQTSKQAESKANWPRVCDRAPLMQRLEGAHQQGLMPWTSSGSEFRGNNEQLLAAGEIVAAIAETMLQEGMEDADDDDYRSYCSQLKQAALEIVDAVKRNSYKEARKAVGTITKSCDQCHETYRG